MTRKDYVLIAAALREARSHVLYLPEDTSKELLQGMNFGLEAAASELAGALARDNPRFDRERFLKAAGVVS